MPDHGSPDLGSFVGALRRFTQSMARSYDMTEMCYELCDRVAGVLGATGAGVAVADRSGRLGFATATSDRIVKMEAVQENEQQGPCVTAYTTQTVVAIGSIDDLDRWPHYRTEALALGLHSVLGVPLSVDGERMGALNVYHDEPRQWSSEELEITDVFANMATAYLLRASELSEAKRLAEQLQRALDGRVVIEQAKGILAGEHGIHVDQAFQLLRTHARNNNLRLHEVASGIVTTGLRIPRTASATSE